LGWFYLSTILDDYSRYIIAWKLCTTMKAEDVTNTLELALKASGCDQAKVDHKPRRHCHLWTPPRLQGGLTIEGELGLQSSIRPLDAAPSFWIVQHPPVWLFVKP
jgi:hypothetical protein